MPGFPQVREAVWLYGPHDTFVATASLRLEEHMDGTGVWTVLLNSPASAPTQRAELPDEQAARAEMARIRAEGSADGSRWRTTKG
ncbi:hypothetical protein ACIA5A_30605 [Micromonospora sp. NPDC051300]|uniref:hypothetical protein n=1 Tax=Micromonospora sp. NPDC051300 TaxID=3364286 RepID=UPI0037B84C28